MSTVTPFPRLPSPPPEINTEYVLDLVRTLESFIDQVRNPGELRGTKLTLTNLQSGNNVGLETGALYELEGFVKITLANVPACSGISGTGAVGTVTVSVS